MNLKVGRERFVTLAAGPPPTLSTSPRKRRVQARGLDTPNRESRRADSNR